MRGTIERLESPVFLVKSRDGAELKIVLADNAVAVGVVKATLADIKLGSFVGIAAMPQADGTQRALEVLIFPDAIRDAQIRAGEMLGGVHCINQIW